MPQAFQTFLTMYVWMSPTNKCYSVNGITATDSKNQ